MLDTGDVAFFSGRGGNYRSRFTVALSCEHCGLFSRPCRRPGPTGVGYCMHTQQRLGGAFGISMGGCAVMLMVWIPVEVSDSYRKCLPVVESVW